MTEKFETKANRLVVVDNKGRVHDWSPVRIQFSEQDEGQTLKVFVSPLTGDDAVQAKQAHREALANEIDKDIDAFPQLAADPSTGHGDG